MGSLCHSKPDLGCCEASLVFMIGCCDHTDLCASTFWTLWLDLIYSMSKITQSQWILLNLWSRLSFLILHRFNSLGPSVNVFRSVEVPSQGLDRAELDLCWLRSMQVSSMHLAFSQILLLLEPLIGHFLLPCGLGRPNIILSKHSLFRRVEGSQNIMDVLV